MKLKILERMVLLRMLPAEGNFATLKIIRELESELGFSEADYKKYKLIQEGNNVKWDIKVDEDEQKDVPIGDLAHSIIVTALKDLDEKQKLTQQHISIFEKFIPK